MSPDRKRDRPDAETTMTSTIVLGAPQEAAVASEQPAKRQRRARPGQGKDARFHQTYDIAMGRFGAPQSASSRPTLSRSNSAQNADALNEAGNEEATNTGPVLRKNKRPSLRLRLAQDAEFESKPRKTRRSSTQPALDFTNAPKDPGEFIWWIAQHITRIGRGDEGSPQEELSSSGLNTMTSVMRASRLSDAEFGDPDSIKEREKEKQRVDNRERKKRWRETNAERNKDNDLRCRVTKLAKNIYGTEDSEEKRDFIEREFETRRSKRTQKERARAPYRLNVPAFRANSDTTTGLKELLRDSLAVGNHNGVQAAGTQLIDMLVDSEGQQVTEAMLKAAGALRSDLASRDNASMATEEAMRILSGNEDLRKALEGGLQLSHDMNSLEDRHSEEDDLPELNGNSEDGASVAPKPKAKVTRGKRKDTTGQSSLHAAISTLTDLAAEGNDISSKPKKQTTLRLTKPRKPDPPKRRKRASRKRQQNSALLDPSSIDAFLALANGGSLDNTTDDDDEDMAMTDAEPTIAADLGFNRHSDAPFDQVLERVARRILTKRLESANMHSNASLLSNGTTFSSPAILEEVQKLKSLLSDSGLSVNMLMPASEARALSNLHTELRQYIESEIGSDGLPENARLNGTVYGSSSRTRSSATGHFGIAQGETPYQRLDHLASLYIAAMPASSASFEDSSDALMDIEDEVQRKVRVYGFPPLPADGFEPKRKTRRGR